MFSLRAPTQPAKPRMKVTPPTTRTNQTGSKPCSWVTWVRSNRIPCKTKQNSSVNQETIRPVPEFSLVHTEMMRWRTESPFHSTPRNQPRWRQLQPAATDTHQRSDRSGHTRAHTHQRLNTDTHQHLTPKMCETTSCHSDWTRSYVRKDCDISQELTRNTVWETLHISCSLNQTGCRAIASC